MLFNRRLHLFIHLSYLRICQGPPTLKRTSFLYVPFFYQSPLFWQRIVHLNQPVNINVISLGRRTLRWRHIATSFEIRQFSFPRVYINISTLAPLHNVLNFWHLLVVTTTCSARSGTWIYPGRRCHCSISASDWLTVFTASNLGCVTIHCGDGITFALLLWS